MITITLKDVPPAIHRSLKARARSRGRSLNKEILAALEETVHGARIDAAGIGVRARMVREAMGIYVTRKDLAALKASGRR